MILFFYSCASNAITLFVNSYTAETNTDKIAH